MKLFNVCSTEIRSVVIGISSIICVYLAISSNGGVKCMRKKEVTILNRDGLFSGLINKWPRSFV